MFPPPPEFCHYPEIVHMKNAFLSHEISGIKGIQLNGFDIVGKEVVVLIENKSKRKK
jgi:hypothetical protein